MIHRDGKYVLEQFRSITLVKFINLTLLFNYWVNLEMKPRIITTYLMVALLILLSFSTHAILSFDDSSSSCSEDYIFVIVLNVNSPWNGEAEFTNFFYYKMQFGSLISSYEEFQWEETTYVDHGRNAAEAVLAKVRVCSTYAEVLQWFDNIRWGTNYEKPGDTLDDTCLKVVTVICDQYGNCRRSGDYTVCPIFISTDLELGYCDGFTKSFTITRSNAVEAGIDIGISIGPISINGLMKNHLLSQTGVRAKYLFKAPQRACAIWRVDYLKSSQPTPIWAFSVTPYDPYGPYVSANAIDSEEAKYVIMLEEVVVEPIRGEIYRIRKPWREVYIMTQPEIVKVYFNGNEAMVFILPEVYSKVESVVWKIWYKQDYEWGNELTESLLPASILHGTDIITLRRLDGYSTMIIVEVVLKDGTRFIREIGIGNYVPIISQP